VKTLIRKIVLAAFCACAVLLVPKAQAQHGLLREIYPNLFNFGIPGLTSNPNFPNNPASVTVISEFEAPDSFGDNYGQRIRGWILPPVSGAYTFWIASDDQSELYLSGSDRPENRQKIAEVFSFTDARNYEVEPNQRSAPITLEAGRFYYIEALTVDGGLPTASDTLNITESTATVSYGTDPSSGVVSSPSGNVSFVGTEIINLIEAIRDAAGNGDAAALASARSQLQDLLFYLET